MILILSGGKNLMSRPQNADGKIKVLTETEILKAWFIRISNHIKTVNIIAYIKQAAFSPI